MHRLSLVSLAAFLLSVSWAQGAEIKLRSRRECSSALVTLGDVAEIQGGSEQERSRLAAVELVPAPAAGQKKFLRAREIRESLTLAGVSLAGHRFTGSSQVELSTPTPEAPAKKAPQGPSGVALRRAEAAARTAILAYLREQTEEASSWVVGFHLTEEQVRLIDASTSGIGVEGGESPWTGERTFRLISKSANGWGKTDLDVVVSSRPSIVFAKRTLGRGELVTEADIELRPAPEKGHTKAITNLADALGRETSRAIVVDQPLGEKDLRSPLLIRRGDVVTIHSVSEGVRITLYGKALDEGGLDDTVVIETETKQKLTTRVTGSREVEISSRVRPLAEDEESSIETDEPAETPAPPRVATKSKHKAPRGKKPTQTTAPRVVERSKTKAKR